MKPLEFRQSLHRAHDQIAHGIGVMYALAQDHEGVIASMNEGSFQLKSYHDNMEQAVEWANDKESARILAALQVKP